MNASVEDLRPTIIPKSDQLNAEQLLGGPITVTVTDVRLGGGEEQPVVVHYENENGRPFKPCKTMRKVLIHAWGQNGREWIGRSMTLYNDHSVKWGGEDVGGIRISHMSDIPRDIKVSLTTTRGKKAKYEVRLLQFDRAPSLPEVLKAIAGASNKAGMSAAKALAEQLTKPEEIADAQAAYRSRVAALKAQPPASAPIAEPTKTLAQFIEENDSAGSKEAALLVLEEAQPLLNEAEFAELEKAFRLAWSEA